MNNWIRCNNCYNRANVAKEPFSLTKCGHAYCSHCITEAERQCPICNTINTPTLLLKEPLDRSIATYFVSLSEHLQQILTISNFQEEQIQISMKRLNELDAKYGYSKAICHKLEIGAAKLYAKYKQDKEQYMKRICNLENENMQLKLALNNSRDNSLYSDFHSAQTSASSLLNSQHTCNSRFQQNSSKVSCSTPQTTTPNRMAEISSSLNRKYHSGRVESDGSFQIPSIHKVLRSAGTRSSASTISTPTGLFPRRL